MMYEAEILEKGYTKVSKNLYVKDGKLFVQYYG
ncbi:unnamed protein product, partial [marine sediment metagenome]